MTPPQNAIHRYLAYRNYLDAVARLMSTLYLTDEALLRTLRKMRGYQVFSRAVPHDLADIILVLRHGWYTELLMRRTLGSPGLFPFVVPWSMVHAYYAIYRGMESYFMLSRVEVPNNHNGALRSMATDLVSDHNPFPQPWRTILEGDPADTTFRLTHAPSDEPITLNNPLGRPDDPWQSYGLLLRTTRKRQHEEMIENWKRRARKSRIPAADRQGILDRMLPTTLFDAIYRLRRRSNYQDSDSFIFSRVPAEQTVEIHEDLLVIVHTTLLVFEALVARVTPADWYDEAVAEFISSCGDVAHGTVGSRHETIREVLG